MNSDPRIVVARVRTVAPARAPNAVWLLGAAECRGDVSAFALLQQHDDQQQQAGRGCTRSRSSSKA